MKRDVDLARAILFAIEKEQKTPAKSFRVNIPGYSPEEVMHHVMLLAAARFIEAADHSREHNPDWRPTGLTRQGQKFLDAARSDEIWQQAKVTTLKEARGLSLYLLKEALDSMDGQASEKSE